MKVFRLVLFVVLLWSNFTKESKAQIDTAFWFAAPWVTPDHWWRDPIAFHFATFNNPTTIRLYQPASTYDTTFTVPANSLFTKYVHFMMDSLESKPANTVLRTGWKIEASDNITVVYDIITRSPNFYNPETYSLKGQNGMGKEFVVPFQTLWRNRTLGGDLNGDGVVTQPKQQFQVVATEDSTWIYITPRCPVVGGHPANVTYSVLLPRKGNVYTCENVTQLTNIAGNNLGGTIVVANKPVSVVMSDDSVNPSGGGGCFDLMGDQIVPTDVIGTEYIVNKGFLNAGSNESIFIVATENFTNVSVNNGVTTTTTILNQGDTYPYSITQNLTYVSTDKPVYLLHMSGYGCEMGEALLPPLNCAGSDQVSFSRANGQSFLLNILVPSGSEGNFLLNGNPALIPAGAFSPVPGTGGAWMGAQISYTTAQVPVGSGNIVTNSTALFALGIINGGAGTGCLYHYNSSFLRRVYTNAGNDQTLCTSVGTVNLSGTVEGGTTTGVWTVLNGSGTLNTPTNLTTTYQPSTSDYAQGTLTFVLSSTGNCTPVRDTMKVTFIQSPVVDAGVTASFCKNNISSIPLSGTLAYAAGSTWSGGNGGAFGNSGSLNTTYTPSPSDLSQDSLIIILTSAGSFYSCPDDVDSVIIYFTNPPTVNPGADQVICSNATQVSISGAVSGASTTGIWSTTYGGGAFNPANNLSTDYLIAPSDVAAGSVILTLSSTNNGNCNAVRDSITISFQAAPIIDITSTDTVCANNTTVNLSGTVSGGYSTTWSTNGSGSIASPSSLNTVYTIHPNDTTAGSIQILLTSTAGICPSDADTLNLVFATPPRVNAGPNQNFCSNEMVQLNGVVVGVTNTGTWTSTGTGSFNPGPTFLNGMYQPSTLDVTNGSVNLILTSTNNAGCNPDDDTLTVTFIPAPTANFTFTNVCQGDNMPFTDLSTTPVGTITGWNWDFGDLGTSITNNPVHPYAASGTFTVTLVAESNNGCRDTIQQNVTVHPLPLADFIVNTPCEGSPVTFTDQSFISSGNITNWEYNFGDGSPFANGQVVSHVFPGLSTYNVTFEVTSSFGCTDTVIHPVTILPRPNAAFTMNPNPVVALENVQFTDQSTPGNIIGWYWNFGDSSSTNLNNPVHNYADGGVYDVILVVTDANGCIDTARNPLIVALLPVLPTAFTPDGNGENDIFLVRGGPFNSLQFNIYNNWGELIFTSNDQAIGWDGTYKGEAAPVGVYTWTVEVAIVDGRIIKKTGDVTLLR